MITINMQPGERLINSLRRVFGGEWTWNRHRSSYISDDGRTLRKEKYAQNAYEYFISHGGHGEERVFFQ